MIIPSVGNMTESQTLRDVPSRRYVLITPCRDEADYLQETIDSVAAQTVLPHRWVIVDDGSTDATPQILDRAAQKYPFIRVVHRDDRGQRSVGPGVIAAFNSGLDTVDLDQYDYLCKLDGDLRFGPRYFERVMEYFEDDPWLGTMSGKTYLQQEAGLVEERVGDENSHGVAKFYRVACFRDIGGFFGRVSWDAIDGHMCRMRGWKATSRHDPELKIVHLRRMGSSQKSFWAGRLRYGRGKYYMGSAWYYVLASGVYRLFERPYVLSGLGIVVGYLQAALHRDARHADVQCRQQIRQFELRSLVFGKRRTVERYHADVKRAFPDRAHPRYAAEQQKDVG